MKSTGIVPVIGLITALLTLAGVCSGVSFAQHEVTRNPYESPVWQARRMEKQRLIRQGEHALRHGYPKAAEHSFRQSLAISPRQPFAWYGLAQSLEAQNRLPEAVQAYRQALYHHDTWGSSLEPLSKP